MDAMDHAVTNRNLLNGNYFVVIRDAGVSYTMKVTVK